MMFRNWTGICCLLAAPLYAGCSGAASYAESADAARAPGTNDKAGDGGWQAPCGGACPSGFHCEFDACVQDEPVGGPSGGVTRDPLASNRYVFSLEVASRRLVRIDSLTLEVAAFAAGLMPMDVAVIGNRELSVLLDGFNLIEVLDHRQEPPVDAAWTTARSLSHLKPSPTGMHVIAYFDWDDPRAQDRQGEPGNINQISVLALEDAALPFNDADARLVNVAVGFLPRDVRYSADGSRAVIVSQDSLTPIGLLSIAAGVAVPETPVAFDSSAVEIVIDADAAHAILRYDASPRIDVVPLDGAAPTCLAAAAGAVTDVTLTPSGDLVVISRDLGPSLLHLVRPAAASLEPCAPLPAGVEVGDATLVAVDPSAPTAIAYQPSLEVESIAVVDLGGPSVRALPLEKAIAAVAFVGDGAHALLSHLKAPGTPAWDPRYEDPAVSVDRSYGVSWLNALSLGHRLAVSDVPFGPFSFVPATAADGEGATFQTVSDEHEPQVLRVTHRPGFDDKWIQLAALPLQMGYVADTRRVWVTQSHPWGRVTFIDPKGVELRHVTGFALEVR